MRIFAGIIMKLHNGDKTCIRNFMQGNLIDLLDFSALCNNKFNKHFWWNLALNSNSIIFLHLPKSTCFFYQIFTIWLLKIFMTLENNLATLCDILSSFLFSRHFLRFINEKGLAHFKGFDKGVTLFLHISTYLYFSSRSTQ